MVEIKQQLDECARYTMAVWREATVNSLRSGCDAKEAIHRADEVCLAFETRFHGNTSIETATVNAESFIGLYGRDGIVGKKVEVRGPTDDAGRMARVVGFSAKDHIGQGENLLGIEYYQKQDEDPVEPWVLARICFVVKETPKVAWKG